MLNQIGHQGLGKVCEQNGGDAGIFKQLITEILSMY